MKFLIADNDAVSVNLLTRLLGSYAQCDSCYSGIEALSLLERANENNEPYDCLFLDIMMPGLDGYGVMQALNSAPIDNAVESTKPVKIIVTSALEDNQCVLQAFTKGCVAYLVKPITREKVFKELMRLQLIPSQ